MKDRKKIRLLYVTNDFIIDTIEDLTKYKFEAYKIGTDGVYVYYWESELLELSRYIQSKKETIDDLGDITMLQLDKIKDRLVNIFRRIR